MLEFGRGRLRKAEIVTNTMSCEIAHEDKAKFILLDDDFNQVEGIA